MYVNVFANLVDDQRIANKDRELAINIVAIYVNFGIVSASVFEIVMDKTFLAFQIQKQVHNTTGF